MYEFTSRWAAVQSSHPEPSAIFSHLGSNNGHEMSMRALLLIKAPVLQALELGFDVEP